MTINLDVHALAEEVSINLRTEKKKSAKERRSFKEITSSLFRERGILGSSWSTLNAEIGKILGARRKSSPARKTSTVSAVTTPIPHFHVIRACDRRVILGTANGSEFTFIKHDDGTVMQSAGTGLRIHSDAAKVYAVKIFEGTEPAAKAARVRMVTNADDHVGIVIDNKYVLAHHRSNSGRIVTEVRYQGETCKQSEVPHELLAHAKACAKQHFKGVGSLSLNF